MSICAGTGSMYHSEIFPISVVPARTKVMTTLTCDSRDPFVNSTDTSLDSELTDFKKHGIHYVKGNGVEGWTHWGYDIS